MKNINKKGESIAIRPESIIEGRFSLTSSQNDIIDMLFCEIEDDEQYQYTISIEKYKSMYKTNTSNLYRDLKKAVKSFEGQGIRIVNKETKEEIFYVWFSKIHYIPKNGEIKVNIDRDFKKLLYEMKKRIYYNIGYTLNFNSVYSKRMYYYLKSFEDTGWRVDTVDNLQQKLDCPKSYCNFSNFKSRVLDVAEKEINETSDINFTYETTKKGNKVTGIKSYISSKPKLKNNKEIAIDKNVQAELNIEMQSKIKEVKSFLQQNVGQDDIVKLIDKAKGNINIVKEKYEIMKRQKVVDDIIGWLLKAIERDYQPNVSYIQQSTFNNFEQRKYDFEELEKKLIFNFEE